MIVDCHSHVFAYPGHLSDEFVREANLRSRGHPIDLNVTSDKHWKAMAGVDKVIVFGMRAFHSGIFTPNEYIAEYAALHPDKVIGFAGVDPSVDDVRETLEHAIGKLKLRGVKLGPVYQNVHPTDPRMMAVYEFCQARRVPIMIHQGTTFPRKAPSKYALPILLEDVALAFPDLKMVIAHLGHPWIDDTLVLIRKQPNFYADISALHYRPWQFYNALITAKEYGVLDKLLFGSDYPFTTPEASIDALRNFNRLVEGTNLPRLAPDDIERLIASPTLEYLGLEQTNREDFRC
ncbi:MAG TPA: amidohydrolase family protein [Bryobacteraceae bacterium]|nr:amidohydrolase family protein [Bryobacteraceae bacterium]